jgi:hypothetical protein
MTEHSFTAPTPEEARNVTIKLTREEALEVFNLITAHGVVDTSRPENRIASRAIIKISNAIFK